MATRSVRPTRPATTGPGVRPSRRAADQGALAIIVALFAVSLFMLAALVVEVGSAREARGTAQAAADAAGLAAAAVVYVDDTSPPDLAAAVAEAARFGAANNFPVGATEATYWNGCTATVPPGWEVTTTPCVAFLRNGSGRVVRVQVVVPGQDTPSFFGAVPGLTRALAQARVPGFSGGFELDCQLCVTGNYFSENSALGTVTSGSVWVNGSLTRGPGSSQLTVAGGGTVQYGTTVSPGGWVTPSPTQAGGPLIVQAAPSQPVVAAGYRPDSGACSPGAYRKITGCSSFAPGQYVVTEGVSTFNANATNAVFYLTCSTGTAPRPCGTGEIGAGLAGSTATVGGRVSGTYQGFALIFDPRNAANIASSVLTVNGAIHAPSATVSLTTGSQILQVRGPLIVGGVTLRASAQVNVSAAVTPFPEPVQGDLGLIK